MSCLMKALQSLVHIRKLGGGSFWRGAAYLSLGLLLIPILLLFGLLLLPPVVRQVIGLLFLLAVVGVVGYVVAIVYARVQNIMNS